MRCISTILLVAVTVFILATSGDTLTVPSPQITAIHSVGSPYTGAISQTDSHGQTLLRLDGVITSTVAHDLRTRIEALPVRRPVTLELNSPGGFTEAGYALIETIVRQRHRGRPVATTVRGNAACQSMCVGIYMAGYPRYADPSAQFMVHAPRGEKTGLVGVRATREMIDRLAALGVSARWLDHVRRSGGFSGRVDFRQSAAELVNADANIVTRLFAGS